MGYDTDSNLTIKPEGNDPKLVSDTVDSPSLGALDVSAMAESPPLRDELQRIEAKIAKIRKQELDVDARIAQDLPGERGTGRRTDHLGTNGDHSTQRLGAGDAGGRYDIFAAGN
jgi:hypothetical protein